MDNLQHVLDPEIELIYQKILSKIKEDKNGVFWEIQDFETIKRTKVNETIYCGVSGIILFLIEYYKYKKHSETLRIIDKSSQWLNLFCINNPTNNFAFYTGRVGCVFTLIKAYKLTGNENIKFEFDTHLKNILSVTLKKNECYDFLNGISGIILGLLHIYDDTKSFQIKKVISLLTDFLISKINIKEFGFFWDKTLCMKGLCGISHGSSGVGLVFLELGRYFNNTLFYDIAKKSFQYENHYYNTTYNNWPDFRHGHYDKETEAEYVENYREGNLSFFHKETYMTAWCHGAPGIGLTRIRAYELLKDELYKNDILDAYSHTEKMLKKIPDGSFTLCHGAIGNSILGTELYKLFKDEKYLQFNIDISSFAIQHRIKYKYYKSGYNKSEVEDLSLFVGISGIGCSFIQTLNPESSFSYLLPTLNGNDCNETMVYTKDKLITKLANKYYPLTYDLINTKKANHIENLSPSIDNLTFNNIISPTLIKKDPVIKYTYKIENEKNKLEDSITSFTYNETRKLTVLKDLTQSIQENSIKDLMLYLNPDVRFFKSRTNITVLYSDGIEIKIIEVDNLLFNFLKKFSKKIKLAEIETQKLDDKHSLYSKNKLTNQTIQLIKMGLIFIEHNSKEKVFVNNI